MTTILTCPSCNAFVAVEEDTLCAHCGARLQVPPTEHFAYKEELIAEIEQEDFRADNSVAECPYCEGPLLAEDVERLKCPHCEHSFWECECGRLVEEDEVCDFCQLPPPQVHTCGYTCPKCGSVLIVDEPPLDVGSSMCCMICDHTYTIMAESIQIFR